MIASGETKWNTLESQLHEMHYVWVFKFLYLELNTTIWLYYVWAEYAFSVRYSEYSTGLPNICIQRLFGKNAEFFRNTKTIYFY